MPTLDTPVPSIPSFGEMGCSHPPPNSPFFSTHVIGLSQRGNLKVAGTGSKTPAMSMAAVTMTISVTASKAIIPPPQIHSTRLYTFYIIHVPHRHDRL